MKIGVPKEVKVCEERVAITPHAVSILVKNGHSVFIEKSAGVPSGFSDEEYRTSGAVIYNSAEEVYENSEMILKVKEPQPSEYKLLKKNQILFAYLHLANEKTLTKELLARKVTSIAYETVQLKDGTLPILVPMSEIAGKMSIQIAANLLENKNGGAGILLSGVVGVPAGKVVILGAGCVGYNAAKIAVGIGANVSVIDKDINKLRKFDEAFGSRVKTYAANETILAELVKDTDVLICSILIPGHKAPKIITQEMVKSMRKGSVIVDVSIDQGGIVETIDRVTTIDNPYFEKYGVLHYSVSNMPGCVPKTASTALVNESIKYVLSVANKGIVEAVKKDYSLACGVNTYGGQVTNIGVSKALDIEYCELPSLIGF